MRLGLGTTRCSQNEPPNKRVQPTHVPCCPGEGSGYSSESFQRRGLYLIGGRLTRKPLGGLGVEELIVSDRHSTQRGGYMT